MASTTSRPIPRYPLFDRAMVELTRLDSAQIVGACDLSGTKRIVDVGGGSGELLRAMLEAHPRMHGVLFDRPRAIGRARAHLQGTAVADRCAFVAGDFFTSIPGRADTYLLKSVIHDWSDEPCKLILRNCRRAMPEHAKLLLVERIVPSRLDPSAAHRSIACSDLNMLVGLGGQERAEPEFRALLNAAGLGVGAIRRAGPIFSVIEAAASA